MTENRSKPFLSAEWRKLIIANYSVDPKILEKYLPAKTELDLWNGKCYVSLVGFRFLDTKIRGYKIPFHVNFEEVNLRFYVRYMDKGEWKRGVVFIREIVPKRAITFVANSLYGEKYATMPMQHQWLIENDRITVSYHWEKRIWHSFKVHAENKPTDIPIGSESEFITEHYLGYTKISNLRTDEYEVKHPRWQMYPVLEYSINVDFNKVYGLDFAFLNQEEPASVFLAEGSEIQVMKGKNI